MGGFSTFLKAAGQIDPEIAQISNVVSTFQGASQAKSRQKEKEQADLFDQQKKDVLFTTPEFLSLEQRNPKKAELLRKDTFTKGTKAIDRDLRLQDRVQKREETKAKKELSSFAIKNLLTLKGVDAKTREEARLKSRTGDHTLTFKILNDNVVNQFTRPGVKILVENLKTRSSPLFGASPDVIENSLKGIQGLGGDSKAAVDGRKGIIDRLKSLGLAETKRGRFGRFTEYLQQFNPLASDPVVESLEQKKQRLKNARSVGN